MKNVTTKNIAVFYHGNCPDGFGGAYSAWKKFGNKADYFPLLWQRLTDYKTEAKTIYFIDFSPEGLIKKFKKEGKNVILIDHHISARNLMALGDNSLFSVEKSGATLAWEYFFPTQKTPLLLKHIQDQDTWQFKIKNTKEISKVIGSYDMNFKIWDKLRKDIDNKIKYKELIKLGSYLLKKNDQEVKLIISEGIREARFENQKAYVVNSPFHESIIGNTIAKHGGIGIIWSERRDGKIKVSLRSLGKVDVSKVAIKYGGGGHKNAASFIIPVGSKIPWVYKN